jgi:site-specific DNA-adenine methylase
MNDKEKLLNQKELKQILNYNKDSGIFTWKVSPSNSVKINDVAGTTDKYGYIVIMIKSRNYFAHRLAFLCHIKNNKDYYPDYVVAHCGFNATFGAKWFGGFARKRKNGWDRDCVCGKNLLLKQENGLKGVILSCCSYYKLEIPDNSIIYCDPPYENTTKYKDKFNHSEFWDWCRKKRNEGHKIFISEYNAPNDFICLWQKEIVSSLTKKYW